ncbi:aldo/keto reductase [Halorubrum laminariae]|uniref:Aldo/keto reductase n=1 Tax=Halorubrum laminariae TaxID=1433523 RepID=A0ABD6C3V5_9EURY|nr:aldo/keto reductase [Halorubrum laminariae]
MDPDIRNASDTFEFDDGTTVNRLGFGAMRLTGEDIIGAPGDEAEATRVLQRAVEAGVDFVDTADSYGPGVSERLIGEAIDDDPDVLVASKAGLLRNREGDWTPHGDPEFLKNQVLCSLDRLGVDTIDLYQFHRPDPDTDFEASVHAFAEMKDEKQIERVGLSNVSVEQLETALDIVDVATVQNRYDVGNRDEEAVLRACEKRGIGFIPWGPMYAVDEDEAGPVLDSVAERRDATPHQVALAWLLGHSDVTLPIPGTSSVDHLESNLEAARLELTDEDVAALDGIDPR